LAGIPLTAGFIGKFYIFVAGITGSLWLLVGTMIIGSGIGLFYYLRIIFTMTKRTDEGTRFIKVPVAGAWIMISLTLALVLLGIYPTPVIELINLMIAPLI
ncbi:MAG: proton-conducting transporter membrane subunit, partial [Pseudohongiellaceae bacterium]